MSYLGAALILQPEEAERVPLPHGGGFELLADASQTDGVLGANRLTLGEGADGARPHYHALSTEVFYVIDGALDFFIGDAVTTVDAGGLVVVPPKTAHAFGAAPGSTADLIAIVTPGVERFDYFRALGRIQHGLESFDTLVPEQERYDVHFLDATAWQTIRSR
jgi:quercetin dioxygenase-like cupin family protein